MARVVTPLVAAVLLIAPTAEPAGGAREVATVWQTPPEEVMEVLHARRLPWVWTAPTLAR